MAYAIKIATVDKTSLLIAGSLSVSRKAGHDNNCSFSIKTTAATYLPDVGLDVQVLNGATVIFGGIIQTITHKKYEGGCGDDKLIVLEISSNGYGSIPSRRTIDMTYDQRTAAYVVNDIVTNVLSGEGITAGTLSAGANPVGENGEYDAICKSCAEILNDMAAASGYMWYIDDTKALHFVADLAETAAAHDIVEGGTFTDFQIENYEKSLDGYANKIFVRGGTGDDGYPVKTFQQDTSEQTERATIEGGTGVYGTVINDSNIEVLADATTTATNALKKYGIIPRTLTIKSWTLDWLVGTKLKVNLPTFGISEDTYYLIESVTLQDEDGKNLSCTLQCSVRKSDNFTTQTAQSGIEYLGKVVSKAKEGSSGSGSTYIDSTGAIAQTNLYVDTAWPAGAKAKSVLVDTDDYSRYDKSTLTVNTILAVDANEFIAANGTFTITLHAATQAGIIKKIYNVGTGLVTIAGTINGGTNMLLYPNESVGLITDGTAWRC